MSLNRKTKQPKADKKERTISEAKTKTSFDRSGEDPVFSGDPWKAHRPRSGPVPVESKPSSSKQSQEVDGDPRLTALVQRMEIAEDKHAKLEEKVGTVDKKIDTMNMTMEEKFAQVMQGLAGLTTKMSDGHREKVQKVQDSPAR